MTTISNKIRDLTFIKYNVIFKSNHQICNPCSKQFNCDPIVFLSSLDKDVYQPRKYIISHKFLKRLQNQIRSLQEFQQQQTLIIQQQQELINQLRKNQVPNSKYKRRNLSNPPQIDYERRLKEIVDIPDSNRWKNHLQYKLFSATDCRTLTGRTLIQIIQQAEICKCEPEKIFHARVFSYRYFPRNVHSLMFGISEGALRTMIKTAYQDIDKYWSKPVLLNGIQPFPDQYWTRARVHSFTNCPKFVYAIRGINPNNDQNIYTADGTYQYTKTVQTSHEVRKKIQNGHKHRSLIKVHIWACPNGQPILGQYFFGDGYNSDTQAWSASLDPPYVKRCMRAIINKKRNPQKHAFKTVEQCQTLLNLQELIQINDHVVTDNGYRVRDPRNIRPNDAPPEDTFYKGQTTVLAAAHKRSVSAIRQTQERINIYCKRNAFCRNEIDTRDIEDIPFVWNQALADMNRDETILMRDDANSAALAKRLLDMRNCALNPAEQYFPVKKKKKTKAKKENKKNKKKATNNNNNNNNHNKNKNKNKNKKKNKKMMNSNNKIQKDDDVDDDDDEEVLQRQSVEIDSEYGSSDEELEPQQEQDQEEEVDDGIEHDSDEEPDPPSEKETWEKGGTGWNQIIEFIRNNEELQQIFKYIQRNDIKNYIGKDYERFLARGYLKRMNYHQKNFRIKVHKQEPFVFKIENMKSKYKSANKYIIVLSFKQIELYLRSLKKVISKDKNIYIAKDEQHWFKALKLKDPEVAKYLSQKYKKVMEMLNERRIKRMHLRRQSYFGNWNLGVMKRLELEWLGHENYIGWDSNTVKTVKQLRQHLLKELKKRQKEKNKLYNNNNNNNDNNNNNGNNKKKKTKKQQNKNKRPNKKRSKRTKQNTNKKKKNKKKKQKKQKEMESIYNFESNQLYCESCNTDQVRMAGQCIKCKSVFYCSKRCKDDDWPLHSRSCNALRKRYEWITDYKCAECGKKAKIWCPDCQCVRYCSRSCQIKDLKIHTDECPTMNRNRKKKRQQQKEDDEDEEEEEKEEKEEKKKKKKKKEKEEKEEEQEEEIDLEKLRPNAKIPPSLEYLRKYPSLKSWYDLDFTLFNSKLARSQVRCSCRSGAQLPGCCAHISACLWLIFYVLKMGNIQELLQENPRDERILNTITDLTPYSDYRKSTRVENNHYCWVCKAAESPQSQNSMVQWVECDQCVRWYHPECLGTTIDDVNNDRYTCAIWHCKYCCMQDAFVARNI